MSAEITLLTICGSLRSGSLNRAVVDTLPELIPAGVRLVDAPPIGELPLYNADITASAGVPSGVTALAEAIRAADGVVIVSPEYNFSIPGALKNALDWVSRLADQPFRNKPVALQSASGGLLGGSRMQYHLRQVLLCLDAQTLAKPEVFISFGPDKIDVPASRLRDETSRKMVTAQLASFIQLIQQQRA